MKDQMVHLGVLLLTILFALSIGSLILFFTHTINDLFAIALGVILLIIVVTFVSYLLFDLYAAEDKQSAAEPTKRI